MCACVPGRRRYLRWAAAAATAAPASVCAEEFIEFIGLNADPFSRETRYPPETFFDLGVRYYRMCLKYDLTPPDAPQRVTAALDKYGARPMMLIDRTKTAVPRNWSAC